MTGRFEYQPFGLEENTVTGDDTLTFTGKMQDASTGLMYFNARYYDPTLGRFITEDPVKDGGSWYVYCNNKPIMYIDYNGLEPNKVQATTWSQTRKLIVEYFNGKSITLQGLRYTSGDNTGKQVGPIGGDKGQRYIYTKNFGWIDLAHFFQTAAGAQSKGLTGWKKTFAKVGWPALYVDLWNRTKSIENSQSGSTQWSYEDGPSNWAGLYYYIAFYENDKNILETLDLYFQTMGATTPDKAPNWNDMQESPQSERRFPQNRSLRPVFVDPI